MPLKNHLELMKMLIKYPDLIGIFLPDSLQSDRVREHMQYYDRIGEDLVKEYGGKSGSITDMAKNYAGAYDWARRIDNPEDAERLAALYQWQQTLGKDDKMALWDAENDLAENIAGIKASRGVSTPRSYEDERAMALEFAKKHKRSPLESIKE